MQKWLKILLITLGVIGVVIIGILFYSISSIDKTPYFESAYYANTIEKLNKVIADRKKANGKLQAGFAKESITPKIVQGIENPDKGEFNSIKLSGFGDGKIATGVHDSLFTKAIAINVDGNIAVLVSSDLLLMPPEVAEKVGNDIEKQSNISRKQIFFGATHTHASIGNSIPGFVGKQFGGEYQPDVVNWLSKRITNVILKAVADIKMASFASSYVHAPNLVRNRIIGKTGRLNDKFTILSFKQDSGRSAVIGIFAAHPVSIGSWNDKFSGSYPGYFQRAMEINGTDMAMFYAGTTGSHSNKGEGDKFEKAKFIGETLADSARLALNKMRYADSVHFSFIASEIETPKLQAIYIADDLRLSEQVGHKLMPEIKATYVQSFRLSKFIWIAMPYELSGEYAIDLKNALELQGYNSAFTSFNGQYLGYIVPAKYYYYDTYEARLMGWYGPSMGDYLMELNYLMADSLTGFRL